MGTTMQQQQQHQQQQQQQQPQQGAGATKGNAAGQGQPSSDQQYPPPPKPWQPIDPMQLDDPWKGYEQPKGKGKKGKVPIGSQGGGKGKDGKGSGKPRGQQRKWILSLTTEQREKWFVELPESLGSEKRCPHQDNEDGMGCLYGPKCGMKHDENAKCYKQGDKCDPTIHDDASAMPASSPGGDGGPMNEEAAEDPRGQSQSRGTPANNNSRGAIGSPGMLAGTIGMATIGMTYGQEQGLAVEIMNNEMPGRMTMTRKDRVGELGRIMELEEGIQKFEESVGVRKEESEKNPWRAPVMWILAGGMGPPIRECSMIPNEELGYRQSQETVVEIPRILVMMFRSNMNSMIQWALSTSKKTVAKPMIKGREAMIMVSDENVCERNSGEVENAIKDSSDSSEL